MINDIEEKQSFITKMPAVLHKRLKRMAMSTGYTMQDIGNYAISKEVDLFEKQSPNVKNISLEKTSDYVIGKEEKKETETTEENNNI